MRDGLRIIHAADLHMDSPFEALSPAKAAQRRAEQRGLLERLGALVRSEGADLVLLSGDLLDGAAAYRETVEALAAFIDSSPAKVFIAPGNHDFYSSRSAYASLAEHENVHIFKDERIECVSLPELSCRVYGAAFTHDTAPALPEELHAEKTEGVLDLLCIHGEVGAAESKYRPVSEAVLAASGIDYAAFGHVHKPSGLRRAGDTFYSWPGCPEGRGFDETGERYINIVDIRPGDCALKQVCIAKRRYEILSVDVSSGDVLSAISAALPEGTGDDIYRLILTGETDSAPDVSALERELAPRFFALQLRDATRLRRELWEGAGSDTLRGIFLSKLLAAHAAAKTEDERGLIEQAVKWGLAALDNAEEVVTHEN